jgi:hypothetical protein
MMANARLESKPKPGPPASNTTWWTDRRLRWHASPIASLDDLPPLVKTALVEKLKPGEMIRQIISAPRQHVLGAGIAGWRRWLAAVLPWDWTPDWTLVVTGSRLLVAASTAADEAPVITETPIAELLSFELGTILLFSWIDWAWVNEGRLEHQRIYFNTVSDRLFWETLAFLRRSLITDADLPPAQSGRGLERLANLPYKFKNLIPHRLLLPDEEIQALVYRPDIWTARIGPFRRKRAPALALALTNYHLVVTQEDMGAGLANYGLITRYYPRNRIAAMTLEHAESDLWLKITLAHEGAEDSFRVLFEPTAEQSLREVVAKFGDVAASSPAPDDTRHGR